MITVGSKVVCINDRFPVQVLEWARFIPRAGRIYTVSRVKTATDATTGVVGPAVDLEEIDNRGSDGWQLSFSIRRFREATLEERNAATAAAKSPAPEVIPLPAIDAGAFSRQPVEAGSTHAGVDSPRTGCAARCTAGITGSMCDTRQEARQ